jgi:hypothetical protein
VDRTEEEEKNAYRILLRKSLTKRPVGRPRRRLEDNIKTHLMKISFEDRGWMELAQECVVFAVLSPQILLPAQLVLCIKCM